MCVYFTVKISQCEEEKMQQSTTCEEELEKKDQEKKNVMANFEAKEQASVE